MLTAETTTEIFGALVPVPTGEPLLGQLTPEELAAEANEAHEEVETTSTRAVEAACRAGSLLIEAKKRLSRGEWLPFVAANCRFSGRTAQAYMRLAKQLQDPANAQRVAGEPLRNAIRVLSAGHNHDVLTSHESDDWCTPPEVLEPALKLLERIDLDPCHHPQSLVNAGVQYSKKEDGLGQHWQGKVFLNPPYSDKKAWITKLVEAYDKGWVTEAIALLPSSTEAEWFELLDKYPRCFVRRRLRFVNSKHTANHGSVVFYLGKDVRRFERAFRDLGTTFVRYKSKD